MTKAVGAHGRIDKRQAILDGAFAVFARRGYSQACVQEIANEAGVAKPTVYNHLTDKETLFRHAVEAVADAVGAQCLAAVGPLREADADLRVALGDSALRLLRICAGEQSRSLRALTAAQLPVFPDLIVLVQERTSGGVAEALGDRMAHLMLAGRLRTADPATAAEQFLALLTGPLQIRSRAGTRKVTVAELRAIADSAVDTFLRAYEPAA